MHLYFMRTLLLKWINTFHTIAWLMNIFLIPGNVEGGGWVGLQPYHFCCWDLFPRAPVEIEYEFYYLKVIEHVYSYTWSLQFPNT